MRTADFVSQPFAHCSLAMRTWPRHRCAKQALYVYLYMYLYLYLHVVPFKRTRTLSLNPHFDNWNLLA